MTLAEAIRILEHGCTSNEWAEYKLTIQATKLGIEALKFRQRWEQQEGEDYFPILPGETEDVRHEPFNKGI